MKSWSDIYFSFFLVPTTIWRLHNERQNGPDKSLFPFLFEREFLTQFPLPRCSGILRSRKVSDPYERFFPTA